MDSLQVLATIDQERAAGVSAENIVWVLYNAAMADLDAMAAEFEADRQRQAELLAKHGADRPPF